MRATASSTTSSRGSTSSPSSDAVPPRSLPAGWLAARLVHPFPSSLNAVVTGLIAVVAGGSPGRVAVLAAAMLFLQFSIGALNDWADAVVDADRPAKPIVAGVVGRRTAMAVAVATGATGLALAFGAEPILAMIAVAGLAAGFAYDLGLKGTAEAWLCFAAGFVLLPLFAWYGAAGAVPTFLPWIVLLALPVGGVVSLANGLVDLEADAVVRRRTPAVLLGRHAALRGLFALHVAIVAGAASSLARSGAPALAWFGLALGAAVVAAGWWVSRGERRDARQDGWHLQAIGLAVLAGSWFAGMAA